MDETRVNRYKEYRQSFIKEGAINLDDVDEELSTDRSLTTSTLPMEEVINAVQEEENQIAIKNNRKRNRTIKIVVEISVAVIVVVGLVILGIFAWGK